MDASSKWTGPLEAGTVAPMAGRRRELLVWRRGPETVVLSDGALVWTCEGVRLEARTEGDMNALRARALALGDKTRLAALDAAWTRRGCP